MYAHTHATPPSEAEKSIRLINILFHTHLGPYVTHIYKLGSWFWATVRHADSLMHHKLIGCL